MTFNLHHPVSLVYDGSGNFCKTGGSRPGASGASGLRAYQTGEAARCTWVG